MNKAVILQGAGIGQTNITVNGNQSLTVTKQAAGVIDIQGFSFSASNVSDLPHPIVVQGAWLSAQPVIFSHNAFTMSNSTMFRYFRGRRRDLFAQHLHRGRERFFVHHQRSY